MEEGWSQGGLSLIDKYKKKMENVRHKILRKSFTILVCCMKKVVIYLIYRLVEQGQMKDLLKKVGSRWQTFKELKGNT